VPKPTTIPIRNNVYLRANVTFQAIVMILLYAVTETTECFIGMIYQLFPIDGVASAKRRKPIIIGKLPPDCGLSVILYSGV